MRPTFFIPGDIVCLSFLRVVMSLQIHLALFLFLYFTVDLLLLLGSCRLSGSVPRIGFCCLGAMLGAIYSGVCLQPGFSFLGGWFWRIVCLATVSVLSFGLRRSTVRKCCLYVFLSLAMCGLVGDGQKGFVTVLLCGCAVYLLCRIGLPGAASRVVPVELTMQGRKHHLQALVDTGNMLTDPLTGTQVLVLGAQLGKTLLGLEQPQLEDPITAMQRNPMKGLRLLPYSSVGRHTGLMLALAMDQVRIDGKTAGRIVAFSPQFIGQGEDYQALTGGIV